MELRLAIDRTIKEVNWVIKRGKRGELGCDWRAA
jgi:hypothetical protein